MFRGNPQRFSMTYKAREAKVYLPIEHKLMDELGTTRGDLHKLAIKELWNSRQQHKMQLV